MLFPMLLFATAPLCWSMKEKEGKKNSPSFKIEYIYITKEKTEEKRDLCLFQLEANFNVILELLPSQTRQRSWDLIDYIQQGMPFFSIIYIYIHQPASHRLLFDLSLPTRFVHLVVLLLPDPRIANHALALLLCQSIVFGGTVQVLFHTESMRITEPQIVLCIGVSQVRSDLKIVGCCFQIFRYLDFFDSLEKKKKKSIGLFIFLDDLHPIRVENKHRVHK